MPVDIEKKKILLRCILRLVRKNSSILELFETAAKGFWEGNFSKQMLSKIFDFDPLSVAPVETLVAESLFNSLEREDLEELFRRYALRKGLEF
jgi:hypothetical protein